MVKVKVREKSNKIIGFVINGHALSDDRDFSSDSALVGEAFDLICNSVAVLSQSVIIGIDEVLKLNCTYEMKDGYLNLIFRIFTSEEIEKISSFTKDF